MKTIIALLFFLISGILQVKGQQEVQRYVDFLEAGHLSPKEYIFKLFETSDVVILGERDHRDTTQYDLILDILADERFINQIGHVYSEVGVINKTQHANSILQGAYSSPEAFERDLLELYRILDFNPLWEKYNMYKYLKGIYNINESLPDEKKITVGFTDCEFEWAGMSAWEYDRFQRGIFREIAFTRDSIMATNFMKLYEEQKPIHGRKKALYIQNQPHAINLEVIVKNHRIKTVGSFLKEAYQENVRIVLLNWYNYFNGKDRNNTLMSGGLWDAAFELTYHHAIGFDLQNTPLGQTSFIYPTERNLRYEQVADGFIFYRPVQDFVCVIGIPAVVDDAFSDELFRRLIIVFGEESKVAKEIKQSPQKAKQKWSRYYNDVRSVNFVNLRRLKRQVNRWL